MKKALFIIALLLSFFAKGQYNYSPRCVKAHELISSLRFDEAAILIKAEKKAMPENLVPHMLEGYRDFLMLIVGENEDDYESLRAIQNQRIDILRNGNSESPWYLSSIAMINLQWAFVHMSFGSYVNAAREARRAYLILEQNNKRYPGFLPDQLGLGVMHALIGTIPDNMRWIASLFNMEGSVDSGREELFNVLAEAGESGHPYLSDEALFFLSFIDLNLQADKNKALELLEYYENSADSNLMLIFSLSKIYMQTGRTDDAINLLIKRPSGNAYYPFYYLDYLTGLAKLNRLDTDADTYFLRFTTNFKGKSYIRSAYQRRAWCALLKGDTLAYRKNMEKVKIYGNNISDGDKLALREAQQDLVPNICLLKARLLFDGGFYEQAGHVLANANCMLTAERDKLEYHYRRGRICHAIGAHDEALQYYDTTIYLGRDLPYYFAANAALQAGNIHESDGNFEKAGNYYRFCMKMDNQEYKNSIRQKAKAGLNRINKLLHKEDEER
ncbi:MAG: hypothetical protein RQ761_02060 [Bacteroidales bacterium]|nr:hypothetical protein [Bacteroidales bacterium]